MTFTASFNKSYEFTHRVCQAADKLCQGPVVVTKQQLEYYEVTAHQLVVNLSEQINWNELERQQRTWVVYCTKVQDKYVFKAKVKA